MGGYLAGVRRLSLMHLGVDEADHPDPVEDDPVEDGPAAAGLEDGPAAADPAADDLGEDDLGEDGPGEDDPAGGDPEWVDPGAVGLAAADPAEGGLADRHGYREAGPKADHQAEVLPRGGRQTAAGQQDVPGAAGRWASTACSVGRRGR